MTTLKLRDGVFTAETEYGIALLDEDHDQYWTLNPSAAIVVRTLLDGKSPDEAVRALTEQYAVDADSAHRDVEELIGELRSAGLVEQHTGHSPARRRPHRWRPEKRPS
ncbi:lasso peptide biosynthesis PqqD family chaperone [Streptomyces ficellus]|uniref:Lasso peptide biosynthesis PqqD family chaperone n=1 Tax=Streptomyces ficellus TaxID=1977088 RepID=A0ABT7Z739_9ACTN|nr:lasso peptide biosynthesis PqqD family chaperone [Streptomyces ficellus]MDN3295285.1 lasso peptide biosynthesis PqqD family chaperone [Streptomyces ficellus]